MCTSVVALDVMLELIELTEQEVAKGQIPWLHRPAAAAGSHACEALGMAVLEPKRLRMMIPPHGTPSATRTSCTAYSTHTPGNQPVHSNRAKQQRISPEKQHGKPKAPAHSNRSLWARKVAGPGSGLLGAQQPQACQSVVAECAATPGTTAPGTQTILGSWPRSSRRCPRPSAQPSQGPVTPSHPADRSGPRVRDRHSSRSGRSHPYVFIRW